MNTADLIFRKSVEDYAFYRWDTSQFVSWLRDSRSYPWLLRFTGIKSIADRSLMSVYTIGNGFIEAVSERTLGHYYMQEAQQDYSEGARYLPEEINEGDKGGVVSEGTCTWTDGKVVVNGKWKYTVKWHMLLGRLTVEEEWAELMEDSGVWNRFYRTEIFEVGKGFIGFDDNLVTGFNGVVCLKEYCKQ